MPWKASDADKFTKKLKSQKERETWATVANRTLKAELAKGTDQKAAEAAAIKAANAVIAEMRRKGGPKQEGQQDPVKTTDERITLQEYCHSGGFSPEIDRDAGVIRGVKLLGLQSSNGNVYPKETVARAVNLYEGAKVNVNHNAPNQRSAPRDYRDRIGMVRNPVLREGDAGLFGDFHFNPKHALAEQLLWDAEHAPENVGFSHAVDVRAKRHNGSLIVEEITNVLSVDLVADPATTRGLYEDAQQLDSEQKGAPGMPETLTLEALKDGHADLVEAIRTEALAEREESTAVEQLRAEIAKQKTAIIRLEEQVKGLDEEKVVLTQELATYHEAEKLAEEKAAIAEMIAEAKLPESAVTEVFMEGLLRMPADERKRHILDRVEVMQRNTASKPTSREQTPGETAPTFADSKSFVTAIT